jgi:signal transduction histidine kinase/ligand-binding sensor domain-containing protein/DNA-binding NarL/FixJ family response regulator
MRLNGFKQIIALLFYLLPFELFSVKVSNLHFEQISTKNGLSQNTVRAILEDKQGFIWGGTLDGLNRYDGYQFIVFKPQLGNSNSLVDHRIKNVYQDRAGYLWIKTYKNEFNCYDPVSDSFIHFLPSGSATQYLNYYEAKNGDVWLWENQKSCLRVRKSKGEFFSLPFLIKKEKEKENVKNCLFLFEDSRSNIWIGGESGLFRIKDKLPEARFCDKYSFTNAVELNNKIYFTTKESCIVVYDIRRELFQEIQNKEYKGQLLNLAVLNDNELLLVSKSDGVLSFNINTKLFEKPQWAKDKQLRGNIELIIDKNNGVWIYNYTGVIWYHNRENQQIKKMELIPPNIAKIIDYERYNILIDSRNLIWITTYGNGLFCYDPATDVLENYKYDANRNSPASDYLLSITEDRYGSMWIGSEYAGIIKVVKSNQDVRIIRPEKEVSIGKNNNVKTVYGDAFNNIWIGTKNGSLYLYDDQTFQGKCIYKDINPYTITEDTDGHIWVGTKGKGLFIIDRNTLKEVARYTFHENDSQSISHNTIFNLLKDNKNRMWMGTFGGGINLVEGNLQSGLTFKRFFFEDGNRSYIRYLFQDSKGLIWAGSSDGIIRFDPEKLIKNPNDFVSYRMDLKNENGINCNDIETIYETDGEIWIGTAGGGLSKYVPATEKQVEHFVSFTVKDGLSGDFVSGILEDKENNLWIGTESGITRFNKKDNSYIVYQFSEKTYGNHFNENANMYYSDGNMFWGSLDGLLVFNPELFEPDTIVPPVTLTNFLIYDQQVKVGAKSSPLKQSISYSNEIVLNYKQNTFTIEFASLILKNSRKNKYIYMLENYDRQWSPLSSQNTAIYKNLPPGDYVFKVKGSNSDGVWSDQVTQIRIVITPPFWKSWYAYVVYVLLVLIILYVILGLIYKFNALNNNIKVEKELTNYKLRFFTNISHEFRTPLTLIRGVIENLGESPELASPQLKKQMNILNRNSVILTRLIEQLLEFRKLQNNVLTLDLEETDIVDFSKEIFGSFQEIADQKMITYRFTCKTDSYILFIDRRKVDKILYNLLSNAFKFTPKGGSIEMSIDLDMARQICLIAVKDSGIGIAKEKQHLLFSRFMQINFSSAGTGIGLSLVKEFTDVHKANIWYESNPEGQGSIFKVEFSTNPETYKGDHLVVSEHPESVSLNTDPLLMQGTDIDSYFVDIDNIMISNYRLLIIEDNDDMRNFLIDEFSKYLMVDSAEDGKIGLQKAIETNPEMIICDVMMPEMDGFEVTRRMKDDFLTCHIPIILLTAHSSVEHQLQGIQCGADAYITKPFSLKYLIARVFKLIEQREQLKKRFSKEYAFDGNLMLSTDKDREFMELIDKILDEHIPNPQFTIDEFAGLANLKRTVFYKKVKGITGLSPNGLIKLKRLKCGAELLRKGGLTVSEVSYKVGFEDPFYFSRCFKAHYNCSPSIYGQFSVAESV